MKKYHVALTALILISLALRLYNLTYHSLWFDEAVSVYWARQSVPRILEVGFTLVEDRLPPLYYLTLKGWTTLFGFSETSVRLPSVFFGVLLVPLTASIALTLFNRRVALITALLVALNPFLIWYAQEARMYAPAALFSTLTVWLFLRIANSDRQKRKHNSSFTIHHSPRFAVILFTLSATAGLYSHLYTGFVLPALGLWLIISYPRAWRLWLTFALSGLIVAAAFAPLALAIWRFSGEAAPADAPLSATGQRAWWLLQSFTVWKAPLPPSLKVIIPDLVAIFALSAYLKPATSFHAPGSTLHAAPHLNSYHQNPLLLVTLLFLTPFLIATLLLFRNQLAFFGERYFIVQVPWLLLLAAVGADNLSGLASQRVSESTFLKKYASRTPALRPNGRAGASVTLHASRIISRLPLSLLLLTTLIPIPGQWSLPAAKEAWRQSVAYLAEHATPNHGILIHPDWVRHPFQFYFQGPGQTYAAFSNVTLETALDGPLQGVVGDHSVIWLIQSHLDGPDPNRLVEQWFAARYPLVTELYPPGISLKGYAPGYQLDTLPATATPVDIRFDNGIHLIGYQTEQIASATEPLFHPPSGWLHVILYWTAAAPVTADATPFVHLLGPAGVWGANLERANDALSLSPPSRWQSDPLNKTIIRHDVDVNLNPATPPGRYQLVIGLHGYQTQYPLGEVEVCR